MKKTSLALLIGLFAVGCGGPQPSKSPAPATNPNTEMMKAHMTPPPGAPGGPAEEKKDGDAAAEKKDGDAAAPAEEKKDTPTEDKKE